MRTDRLTWLLLVVGAACLQAVPLHANPSGPSSILATGDGIRITSTEIEQALRIPLYDLETEKYRLTRRRLEQAIAERLLEHAAAARGMSVSAFVTAEIQDQVADVSQADVDARYQQVREQLPKDESLAKQAVKNALVQERAGRALQALVARLAREAKVSISVRPPDSPVLEVPVGDDPALGPAGAPVTIVEFGDFECPACKESLPILQRLRSLYPQQIRFVYRDFPIASHPQSRPAAEAARCAHEQGQFWAYHDALFAKAPDLKSSDYLKLAESLKLDAGEFAACLNSNRPKAAVAKSFADARRIGLSGTPTFFVNGRYLAGLQTLEALRELVDRELLAARNGSREPFLFGGPSPAAADQASGPQVVPLVNPVGEKGGDPQFRGFFRSVVTARGFEIDEGKAGMHPIRSIGITDTFYPDSPAIYVVTELLVSAFHMFRLTGRFILEDPDGRPMGTVLHIDKALFENEDNGGYLVMRQPPGGFPIGKYRVEIHYGEEINDISLLTLARFKVVGKP